MCLGFGGCGTVQKATPEFLEDRFSELRLYGVLGSSPPEIENILVINTAIE
jgi:hypothetical protein